jgi:hypothetical protein
MPELLLPRLKREIEARLAELRPLVAEVAHLEAAKRALLADQAPVPTPVLARPLPASATTELPRRVEPLEAPRIRGMGSRLRADLPSAGAMGSGLRAAEPSAGSMLGTSARRSAPTDRNGGDADGSDAPTTVRDVIVALVEERPGVSVAEIASVTKIAKPTVATTVSKLKRDGVLADEAGGVKLASRQPLTLEQIAKAAAARDDGVDDAEWDAAKPSSGD